MKYYAKEKLENLIDFKENSINTKILLENNDDKAILIAAKKEQILPNHTTPVDAFLYVIEGEVQFRTQNDEYKISEGEIFNIKANEKHSVLALKNSKFLVVRI